MWARRRSRGGSCRVSVSRPPPSRARRARRARPARRSTGVERGRSPRPQRRPRRAPTRPAARRRSGSEKALRRQPPAAASARRRWRRRRDARRRRPRAGARSSRTRKTSLASLPSPSTRFEAVEAKAIRRAAGAERGRRRRRRRSWPMPVDDQRGFAGAAEAVRDALQRLRLRGRSGRARPGRAAPGGVPTRLGGASGKRWRAVAKAIRRPSAEIARSKRWPLSGT